MPTITFINKYANEGNITRSTPVERKRINERSRQYRRPGQPANYQLVDDELEATNEISIAKRAIGQSKPGARVNQGSKYETIIKFSPSRRESPEQVLGFMADPFNAIKIPMTPAVVELLRFYKGFMYNETWTNGKSLLSKYLSKEAWNNCPVEKHIIMIREDTTKLKCLLAQLACRKLSLTQGQDSVQSLVFVNQATMSFSEKMQRKAGKIDTSMLTDAVYLYMAAAEIDQRACAAHKQGIRAIANSLIDQGLRVTISVGVLVALADFETGCRLLQFSGHWVNVPSPYEEIDSPSASEISSRVTFEVKDESSASPE